MRHSAFGIMKKCMEAFGEFDEHFGMYGPADALRVDFNRPNTQQISLKTGSTAAFRCEKARSSNEACLPNFHTSAQLDSELRTLDNTERARHPDHATPVERCTIGQASCA